MRLPRILALVVLGGLALRPGAALAGETFVYVHGAWNGGFMLRPIEQLLRGEGHTVYRPTLTGLGERVHLASSDIDLETHIQDVVNVILWEDLHDVVLVGRSYGGMVVTGVMDRIPTRLKRVIYVDAFLPENGESVVDLSPRPVKLQDDGFVPPFRRPASDTPPYMVPQPGRTFTQKLVLRQGGSDPRLPVTYILTVDAGKTPEQDDFFRFSERARARGWKVVVIEGDHAPEMSRPAEFLPLLTSP